ncbi:hypothetical protein [Streptomyces sp. DH7]|uniref:hypothetical protein n=1 Tax=Streptomyces sp. DH7 TaxID=2857006 RepID=UPI001E5BDC48|nr:hypothetical protein [Streptomyces sp. DH7]
MTGVLSLVTVGPGLVTVVLSLTVGLGLVTVGPGLVTVVLSLTVGLGLVTVGPGLVTMGLSLVTVGPGLLVVLLLPVMRPRFGSGRWVGFPRCGPVTISPS